MATSNKERRINRDNIRFIVKGKDENRESAILKLNGKDMRNTPN